MSDEANDTVDVQNLQCGDHHYRAYVGPAEQYDFIGAAQFRLLCTLGLRGSHRLLDFGCGSLRAGRLFLSYLEKGRYFGIEPNKWLIEAAISNQIGEDLVRIKSPRFEHVSDFSVPFSEKFDFILAQSIFSHTHSDLLRIALNNLRGAVAEDGLIAATFFEGPDNYEGAGWVYPGCVKFRPSSIVQYIGEAGLHCARIPWYHPNGQTWYLLARSAGRLPTTEMHQHLGGRILFDPKLGVQHAPAASAPAASAPTASGPFQSLRLVRKSLGAVLPRQAKDALKSMIGRKAA